MLSSPGDVPMPQAVFETDSKSKHDHIEAIVSIRPDDRRVVPDAEIRRMVSGVHAKNPLAVQNLISTKIVNVYDYVSGSEEITSRQDLTLYDVMAMGCLAITEAGLSSKPDSSQIKSRLITQSKYALGRLLTNSKLIPSLREDSSAVAIGAAHGHEDRIMEPVLPVGGAGEAIAMGAEAENVEEGDCELERNVIVHQAAERLHKFLTERDRKILLGRYCMGQTIKELGLELGVTHQYISLLSKNASAKARSAAGHSPELFYKQWMPDSFYLEKTES